MTSYKQHLEATGQMTDADRRFFAEREGGYDGWLDADGRRSTKDNTPPEQWEIMQALDRARNEH